MEAPSSEEEQFQANLKIANKAKEDYSHLYKGLVANLSVEHLEDFANIFNADNVTFDKEVLLKYIQDNLAKEVVSCMDNTWEMCNIGENIATLEMLKNKFKDRQDTIWRPSGKSVEEQTLPIRMQRLKVERNYLKMQIDFQNTKLKELMTHNQMYRNEVKQIKAQRSFIRDQMHRGTVELQNLKSEYSNMISQVLFMD